MQRAIIILALALAAARPAGPLPPEASARLAGARSEREGGQTEKLPPISYVCPMVGDEDVIEDKPGRCRKCGMELKPIRLDSVWSCATNTAVVREKPGKCPLDGRDMVPVTMAVSWTCPNTSIDSMTPGKCPDGSAMMKKFTPRPHGNHNPQHGGLFFMAPDNWHHLEGTYRSGGVFRMYLYDDFTRPLAREEVRQMTGRIITKSGNSFPLVPVQNGRYLEAKIGKVPFPAEMAAKVKFKSTLPEQHFDFAFPDYSKEPVAPVVTNNAAAAKPAPAAPSPAPPAARPAAVGVDPGLIPLPIPDTIPEMLTQLSQRTDQIKRFIDQGAFANVYVPAFQAKDLALALDERKKDLPPEHLKIADPAIKRLVRSAWLLDAFGDIGNKQQISEAYIQFEAAVRDVESVFPGSRD
jgi:heavy metal-binding protein